MTAPALPRVLAIDDEPTMCQIIARSLRGIADVTTVTTVAAAAAELAAHRFDAVVCDVNMPGGGGPVVHAQLTRQHPTLALRTLFITGGVTTDAKAAFVESVRDRLLEKPFSMRQLQDAVRALLAPPP